jgi:hypothetical protein
MIAECGDALSGRVGEEFDVVKDATAADEAIKLGCPAFLPFVAVAEFDVRMNEGNWER